MSLKPDTLLNQLGDNWHNPHPYRDYILSVVPTTQYVNQITDSLLQMYVQEHYDFKVYKTPTKYTVYDLDLDIWTDKKKKLEDEMKKEEEALEKLSNKFTELQKFLNPDDEEDEQEDEEEEEKEVVLPTERGKDRVKVQVNKAAVINKKEEEKRKAKQAKLTQANMATSQEKLMSLQKEIEVLEKKIEYYGHYKYADKGLSNSMKQLAFNYEKTRDLETLVKELEKLYTYYDMIRRRYVPQDKCCGEKGLCETHLLPLSHAIYSETGMIRSARCPLYPKN